MANNDQSNGAGHHQGRAQPNALRRRRINRQLDEDEGFTYMECRRNVSIPAARYSVDGCTRFIKRPAGHENSLLCDACGCHRSFHRKVVVPTHHHDAAAAQHLLHNNNVPLVPPMQQPLPPPQQPIMPQPAEIPREVIAESESEVDEEDEYKEEEEEEEDEEEEEEEDEEEEDEEESEEMSEIDSGSEADEVEVINGSEDQKDN